MATNIPQLNAIGVKIELTIKEDGSALNISSASKKDIILKKPDGTTSTKTGVFATDGTDGKIKYLTVSGDLDIDGRWGVQGDLVVGTFTGKTAKGYFDVANNL